MNWAIVLLVAAGCSMCNAQTKAIQRPVASRPSTLVQQGLIPLVGGARCPIRACRRNEVLRTCGLCYENTCAGAGIEECKKICYCGCYCRIGYVRSTTNGPCVLPKQCPILPTP